LFKGVISKNLSDMNVIRKIEFPIILASGPEKINKKVTAQSFSDFKE
jgi:hypothetical protein